MSKENINYMEKVPYFKEDIISILYSAAEITDREELYDSYMSAAHDIISNNIKVVPRELLEAVQHSRCDEYVCKYISSKNTNKISLVWDDVITSEHVNKFLSNTEELYPSNVKYKI